MPRVDPARWIAARHLVAGDLLLIEDRPVLLTLNEPRMGPSDREGWRYLAVAERVPVWPTGTIALGYRTAECPSDTLLLTFPTGERHA